MDCFQVDMFSQWSGRDFSIPHIKWYNEGLEVKKPAQGHIAWENWEVGPSPGLLGPRVPWEEPSPQMTFPSVPFRLTQLSSWVSDILGLENRLFSESHQAALGLEPF